MNHQKFVMITFSLVKDLYHMVAIYVIYSLVHIWPHGLNGLQDDL